MIIGNLIMGDAVQPRGEWQPHVFIITDGLQGFEKYLAGQVFGIMHITSPEVDVVIDALHILLVELSKRLRINFGALDQFLFFMLRVHSAHAVLPAG